MKLGGWGRFPIHEARVTAPRDEAALADAVRKGAAIARGNGRAYGDSAVSVANTIRMRRFDRMIAFDDDSGVLVAEAGVLLGDVIAAFLGRGWFPAVTPGTRHVTLGGMIAADVHGKNHHRDGSLGNFVEWIDLMGPDGTVRRCSRNDETELFAWTVGGMGLTGVILRAALRLRPVETAWIRQTTVVAPDLDAAMDAFEAAGDATYSVAWIDCLNADDGPGRSLIYLGEHAAAAELDARRRRHPLNAGARRRVSVPFDAPPFLLNGLTARAFNRMYYRNGSRKAGSALVDWDSYFYPLDAVRGWNRVYGRRGLVQFQCVLPLERSREGLRALLAAISDAGVGALLAVLKRFGEQTGRFSFPMPGYTLALDFPANRRALELMDTLDRIVIEHGGRFYLAKDARMSADTLAASDPRARIFAEMRKTAGLAGRFDSAQSERLAL